jgi:nucleoside-diphosphate-sugar epimerase
VNKVFIAGCGYIGERVARLCRDNGLKATCLVRSPEHAQQLADGGFEVVTALLDQPQSIQLPDISGSVLFYLVPPPGGGIFDTRARNFCAVLAVAEPLSRIVYLSATSVYSETGGGVVTEASLTEPLSAMGKRRLDAERCFQEYGQEQGIPVVILRVSGIYGPGRLPLMQISQGQPLLREKEAGPSNRIHADDLAAVCLAAAERGVDGDIFNVSDGNPSSMTAYFNAVADALGLPRQPQVTLEEARRLMSPLMFSYVSESRVVHNSRMLKTLGVTLRYPTLAEGLEASRVAS